MSSLHLLPSLPLSHKKKQKMCAASNSQTLLKPSFVEKTISGVSVLPNRNKQKNEKHKRSKGRFANMERGPFFIFCGSSQDKTRNNGVKRLSQTTKNEEKTTFLFLSFCYSCIPDNSKMKRKLVEQPHLPPLLPLLLLLLPSPWHNVHNMPR